MKVRKISSEEMNRRLASVVAAHVWREAAIADGWSAEPTYGDHEPIERACRLTRDGFVVQIISRDAKDGLLPNSDINIWGPDGLQIKTPQPYDSNQIISGIRTCNNCGASDVETQRYGFAGRCCADCRPEMAAKYEKPGWTR